MFQIDDSRFQIGGTRWTPPARLISAASRLSSPAMEATSRPPLTGMEFKVSPRSAEVNWRNMRYTRARLSSLTVFVAAAASLAFLACPTGKGRSHWSIDANATLTYPGGIPVPSGEVILTMNVIRDGQPQPPLDQTWQGSFTNGALHIPSQSVILGFDGSFYTDKAVWVLSTVNSGMFYAETAYFFPLLVVDDPAQRTHTLTFRIHEQPPSAPQEMRGSEGQTPIWRRRQEDIRGQ